MRVFCWMVLVLWLPGQVLAAPEPPPPGDYPGAQYIDRTGCVFLRQGADWTPRLDKEGAPICGFPPSQLLEMSEAPETPPSPEDVLTAVLAEGLRSGDLAADASPKPLAPAAPEPAQAELDATLARRVELDSRLRSAMAGRPPDGLCARLGYRSSGDTQPIIGGDVTQGLCPGMSAPAVDPVVIVATAVSPQDGQSQGTVGPPAKARRQAVDVKPAGVKPDLAKPASVIARRPVPPQPAVTMQVDMIPAHARYIEIGIFADEANALAALRRLSGMGYRTAQRKERREDAPGKAVLAGPFADRQALVAALTRLRANGYPKAMAR